MKKFIGNRLVNSEITVDYKTKKVAFTYSPEADTSIEKKWIKVFSSTVLTIFYLIPGFFVLYAFIIYNQYTLGEYSILTFFLNILGLVWYTSIFLIFKKIYYNYVYNNRSRFREEFPKFNAKIFSVLSLKKREKYYRVTSNKQIEIPFFKNIYLNYYTEEDFSDYLERIEIKEYPYHKVSNKGKKEEYMNNRFKAIFYFKKNPKEGHLYVEYH